ncbi:hypothetical protein [Streptomyces sp. NPDC007100]|uniref:hypothetical protein n=1 Tax=Streptomyces sp. NPDC007100 TaxID=3155602 RepID=UPI0033E952DD
MHPFSLCAPLLAALLLAVGGSPGGAYATAPLADRWPAAVGAPVPSGEPVPYGGAVRCSVPGDCLPAVVTVVPGPGPGAGRARPALPATGGGAGLTVAALGAVLVIIGAVAGAVGRDLRNRRRRAAGIGRAED